jgi:hypothetical protein
MKIKNLLRNKTIAQQASSLKFKFPEWNVDFNAISLTAIGKIKPTSRSEAYTVEIKYFNIKKRPLVQVKILDPILIQNEKEEQIPHMYSQESLCLFMPKYNEFKKTDLICDTIIPWATLWLYYYETWHTTGKWLGGGVHV